MSNSMIVGVVGMMIPATAARENRRDPVKATKELEGLLSDRKIRFARTHHSTNAWKTPRSLCFASRRRK
jgi:hypothetical protein